MGVELHAVRTALSLEQALGMLGLEVRRAEEDDDEGDELEDDIDRASASSKAPVPFADMFGGERSRKRGSSSEA